MDKIGAEGDGTWTGLTVEGTGVDDGGTRRGGDIIVAVGHDSIPPRLIASIVFHPIPYRADTNTAILDKDYPLQQNAKYVRVYNRNELFTRVQFHRNSLVVWLTFTKYQM